MVEIGRKVRAPVDEIPGVQTYSRLWGYKAATLTWLGVALAAVIAGLLAVGRGGPAVPLLGLVLALGAAGFHCVRSFLALAQHRDAVESASDPETLRSALSDLVPSSPVRRELAAALLEFDRAAPCGGVPCRPCPASGPGSSAIMPPSRRRRDARC